MAHHEALTAYVRLKSRWPPDGQAGVLSGDDPWDRPVPPLPGAAEHPSRSHGARSETRCMSRTATSATTLIHTQSLPGIEAPWTPTAISGARRYTASSGESRWRLPYRCVPRRGPVYAGRTLQRRSHRGHPERCGPARRAPRRADLRRANLDRSNLQNANLAGARLQGASLVGAQLKDAILVGARLEGADLDRAALDGAILERAQLEKVAGLSEAESWRRARLATVPYAFQRSTRSSTTRRPGRIMLERHARG